MRRLLFRTAPLLLVSLSALAASPDVRGDVAKASVVSTMHRGTERTPWLVTGTLVAASARDPEVIARDAIATHAPWAAHLELAHDRTTTLLDGSKVVALTQHFGDVPVISRGVRVLVEADGRVSMLTSALQQHAPSSLVPKLDSASATRIAFDQAGMIADSARVTARLVVVPAQADGGEARLAWGVMGSVAGLPFRPVVLVDAESGAILQQYDGTRAMQQAKVYDQNPISTPDTKTVTLANDATKTGLENALVTTRNCIDHHEAKDVTIGFGTFKVHVCALERTVKPNAAGDYTDIAPGTGHEAEDPYAELSMFFHTNKAYEFARSIGLPSTETIQVTAVANLRMPDGYYSGPDLKRMANPDTALLPFDNAFYSPSDPILGNIFGVSTDAMWFGQGGVDFGYDGDVVYHEFGHFVVNQTLKLGFGAHPDQFGLSYSPGAMNEGIADLFSSFITGDPNCGEYAATAISPLAKAIRKLDNKLTFPDAITGEVHQDSQPFSAAVWSVYAKLDAAKKVAFQKTFLKAMMSSPTGDLGFADFATLLEKVFTAASDAKTADDLAAAFKERGITKDDARVRAYVGDGVKSIEKYLALHAPSKRALSGKADFAPGLFQIRYDAPAGGQTKLHVDIATPVRAGVFGSSSGSGAFGGGGTFIPGILAKAGGEPIKFTYGPAAHDAVKGDCVMSGDKRSAACDVTVDVAGTFGTSAPVHVMVINLGDADGDYDNVRISAEGPPEPPVLDDAGTDAAPPGATPATSSGKGCACTVTKSGDEALPITFALGALGMVIARRRRPRRA